MILHKNLAKITVSEKTKIVQIAKIIDNNGYNGVFVCDKNLKILGIITDSDLRKLILNNEYKKSLSAKKVMNKNDLEGC